MRCRKAFSQFFGWLPGPRLLMPVSSNLLAPSLQAQTPPSTVAGRARADCAVNAPKPWRKSFLKLGNSQIREFALLGFCAGYYVLSTNTCPGSPCSAKTHCPPHPQQRTPTYSSVLQALKALSGRAISWLLCVVLILHCFTWKPRFIYISNTLQVLGGMVAPGSPHHCAPSALQK